MPLLGGKKGKGFDLDCIATNFQVTIVTCCGFIFQGTIQDEEHTRAQYGCPVVFPAMTMDYDKEYDKEDKKEHCPKPKPPVEVDVDVKCVDEAKFICLQLTCVPTYVCCTAAGVALIAPPINVAGTLNLFTEDNTILINVKDIVAIGPSTGCFADPL